MKHNYPDITSRISDPPLWYDSNGVPRYDPFSPDLCPDIYSQTVVLMVIACQSCGNTFDVEMHYLSWFPDTMPLPREWHYGDPPRHDCVGDTMNCDDLEILQVWQRDKYGEWRRITDLEGPVDE